MKARAGLRRASCLLEVLVAIVILSVGLLPVIDSIRGALRQRRVSEAHLVAGLWAREIVTRLVNLEFGELCEVAAGRSRAPKVEPPAGFSGSVNLSVTEVEAGRGESGPALLEIAVQITWPAPEGRVVLHRLVANPALSLLADGPLNRF